MMYQNDDGKLEGIVRIQVDDLICAAAPTFIDKEDRASKEFSSKAKHIIDTEGTKFNSVEISQKANECAFTMTRNGTFGKLKN